MAGTTVGFFNLEESKDEQEPEETQETKIVMPDFS